MGARNRNSVVVLDRQATQSGGIGFLELVLGLLKSLQIRALTRRSSLNKSDFNVFFKARRSTNKDRRYCTQLTVVHNY
jgi:hypothetical protein